MLYFPDGSPRRIPEADSFYYLTISFPLYSNLAVKKCTSNAFVHGSQSRTAWPVQKKLYL